jgi:hypothetical protein
LRGAGQTAGHRFESLVSGYLHDTFGRLGHVRPGTWRILPRDGVGPVNLAECEQYEHLTHLEAVLHEHPELRATFGAEYLIKPDVVVLRAAEKDATINKPGKIVDGGSALLSPLRVSNRSGQSPWFLHASVSCKWTLRSDRAQNARSEALNMIRNRRGRVPHIVAVTAEPLPMRLASLAMGSSDLDCVYHIALPELQAAVAAYAAQGHSEQQETLAMLVDGKRLRDISDLPLDLAV